MSEEHFCQQFQNELDNNDDGGGGGGGGCDHLCRVDYRHNNNINDLMTSFSHRDILYGYQGVTMNNLQQNEEDEEKAEEEADDCNDDGAINEKDDYDHDHASISSGSGDEGEIDFIAQSFRHWNYNGINMGTEHTTTRRYIPLPTKLNYDGNNNDVDSTDDMSESVSNSNIDNILVEHNFRSSSKDRGEKGLSSMKHSVMNTKVKSTVVSEDVLDAVLIPASSDVLLNNNGNENNRMNNDIFARYKIQVNSGRNHRETRPANANRGSGVSDSADSPSSRHEPVTASSLSSSSSSSSSHISDSQHVPVVQAVFLRNRSNQETLNDNQNEMYEVTEDEAWILNETKEVSEQQISVLLHEFSIPRGLAIYVGENRKIFPLHYWIIDNSGSMRSSDGREIRRNMCTNPPSYYLAECTRWKESQSTVIDHAKLAGILEIPTTFRLLNDPGSTVGNQEFTVASARATAAMTTIRTTDRANRFTIDYGEDVQNAIGTIKRTRADGITPLTSHLWEYHRRISELSETLKHHCCRAVVVIATDAVPSNEDGDTNYDIQNEFVTALRQLGCLPVWIVIRLCTNDEEVVRFYNNLDRNLEFSIDVLDDYMHEAKEVHVANPWLNYMQPLHRCREMGLNHHTMDFLDERLLNRDELLEFFGILFGVESMERAPCIYTQWSKFSTFISRLVVAQGKHWSPKTGKMEYWIDMKKLNKIYGVKPHSMRTMWFF